MMNVYEIIITKYYTNFLVLMIESLAIYTLFYCNQNLQKKKRNKDYSPV